MFDTLKSQDGTGPNYLPFQTTEVLTPNYIGQHICLLGSCPQRILSANRHHRHDAGPQRDLQRRPLRPARPARPARLPPQKASSWPAIAALWKVPPQIAQLFVAAAAGGNWAAEPEDVRRHADDHLDRGVVVLGLRTSVASAPSLRPVLAGRRDGAGASRCCCRGPSRRVCTAFEWMFYSFTLLNTMQTITQA